MRLLHILTRNLTVLNIVLMIVVITCAGYIVPPLFNMNVRYTAQPAKKSETAKEETHPQSQAPSPQDYVIIGEQNLFHPDRKIPVDKPPVQPLPTPEFVLYGTLITSDTVVAYMEDKKAPQTTAGRGKRQISLKKGDTLSGFTLKEIEATKVVMVRGEETMTVQLNESMKPKTREGSPAAPGAPQQPGTVPGQPQQQPFPPVAQAPPQVQPQPAPQPRQPVAQPAQPIAQPAQPVAQPGQPASSEDARKTFLDFFRRGR